MAYWLLGLDLGINLILMGYHGMPWEIKEKLLCSAENQKKSMDKSVDKLGNYYG